MPPAYNSRNRGKFPALLPVTTLLICAQLSMAFNTTAATNTTTATTTTEMWVSNSPNGSSQPTAAHWMECHGLPGTDCTRMKEQVEKLQTLLDKKMPNNKPLYADLLVNDNKNMEDGEEEQVFLTPEQIQYFINTLGNRRRYRRKADPFKEFVSKWPLPIKYAFDGTHSFADRKKIRMAISHWETQTCVRFKEVDVNDVDPADPSRVLFMKYRGCGSYIGKVNISPQPVDLAGRCLRHFGTIVHEIGHVIGFWHEHQRSDRDAYIRVNKNNAIVGLSFVSELMRLGRTSNILPYDYGSVLHYSAKTMSANGHYTIETKDPLYQQTIGQRTGLSFLDAKLANLIYCADSCPTPLGRACKHDGYQDPNVCRVCRCPDGFSGTYCEHVAPSVNAVCGGSIYVSDIPQHVMSPNYYNGFYNDHVECTWLLQARTGYTIRLRFQSDFGIFCIDGVCFHWVEVRYKDSISDMGPRFCCGKLPQLTLESTGNKVLILFRTNYTTFNGHRRGFRATIWAVPKDKRKTKASDPGNWYANGPVPANVAFHTSATRRTTPIYPTYRPTTPPVRSVPPSRFPTTRSTPRYEQKCSPLDVAIILDSSGSVGARNWPKVLEFAVGLVRRLPVRSEDVRVGAVSFGTRASLHFNLLSYTSEAAVSSALRGIRWKDQMTNTSGGIWLTRTAVFTPSGGDRAWAPDVAVLVTDGESNRDVQRTVPEAELAKRQGIIIKVIGVGNRLQLRQVEAIASRPLSDNLYFADTFDDLFMLEEPLVASMCAIARNPPTYGPSTVPPHTTRWPQVTARTSRPTTRFPSVGCSTPGPVDLAFVVDSSGSIGPVNWKKVLDFLQTFVSYLSISPSVHRVGVVTYGTYGQLDFGLGTFPDPDSLVEAIRELRWLDEMTNTSGGIWVTRTLLFDSSAGDRPGAPNIAIVITDGESNRDPQRVLLEAELARKAGISLFVIGVGDKLNMAELQGIANDPDNLYLYHTRGFNDLEYVIISILNVICTITATANPSSLGTRGPTTYRTRPSATNTPKMYSSRFTTRPTATPRPFTTNPSRITNPPPTLYPTYIPYSTRTSYPFHSQPPTHVPYTTYAPYPRRTPSHFSTFPPRRSTPPISSTPAVDCSKSRADVIFVLDSSGSVGRSNWPLMMNFIKDVMRLLPYSKNRNQYAVITFGNKATIEVNLNQYSDRIDMFAAIDRIRWKDEWTNTSGGLNVMREELFRWTSGARADAIPVGVLVTDGKSNRDRARTLPAARAAHAAGVTMFAIGVGPKVNMTELNAIASNPHATYLLCVDDFRRLGTLASTVAYSICAISGSHVTLAPTPDVTGYSQRTRAPQTASPEGIYSDCYPLDLALVIDSSNAVGSISAWAATIRFAVGIVTSLPVSRDKVKIGVVTYGSVGRVAISLDKFSSVGTLVDALQRMPWMGGRTNITGGILVMRSEVLVNTRPSVRNVGVVINAGKASLDAHLITPEADVARQQDIDMFAVGMTSQVSRAEISGIASQPVSTHAFFANSFSELDLVKDNLLRSICTRIDGDADGGGQQQPATTTEPSTVNTKQDSWGPWSSCSRPCGGCGRRWRSLQCTDAAGKTQDCGLPQEEACNARPCTGNDVCTFYVAWREYIRPCQTCCYGFDPDYKRNLCIQT